MNSNGQRNTRALAAIVSVTAIALALVLYFTTNPETERLVLLLSILGGIITALLKIASVEENQHRLNGELRTFREALPQATERIEKAAETVAKGESHP